VHVELSGMEVRLQPDIVQAGDVYLVVDTPGAGPVVISSGAGGSGSAADLAPLSDQDLARLREGSTYLMTISAGYGTGAPHGNVHKLVLDAGHYALLADNPERLAMANGGTIPSAQLAVLEVLPAPQ
jgi:hypothetical protein